MASSFLLFPSDHCLEKNVFPNVPCHMYFFFDRVQISIIYDALIHKLPQANLVPISVPEKKLQPSQLLASAAIFLKDCLFQSHLGIWPFSCKLKKKTPANVAEG